MRGRGFTILIFAVSVVWAAAAVKAEPCSRDKSHSCLSLPATINFSSVPEISKQIVNQEKPTVGILPLSGLTPIIGPV